MTATASPHAPAATLSAQVRARTGQSAFKCYQCGKCTAGCPLGGAMDAPPSAVLRLLQIGTPEMEAEVLGAYSIWLCVACDTCASRCPQEVDIPHIMEDLRRESQRRGLMHPKAKDILAFQRSFLDTVRRTGRLHEVSLIAAYKLRTGHLLQDVTAAPKLLARGKLGLVPRRMEDQPAVARLFEQTSDGEAGKP